MPADHDPRLIDKVALIVSGAPYPSTRSRNKARAILDLLRVAEEDGDSA